MVNGDIKSFLYWYLSGALFALISLYIAIQYSIYSNENGIFLQKKAHEIQGSFTDVFEKHRIFLSELSKEIIKNKLFIETSKIPEFLEKSFIYGIENDKGEQIHISSINWIGKDEEFPISRFGTLKYKLYFTSEYLENLEKTSGMIQVSFPSGHSKILSEELINFGIGVLDKEGGYRGFLNARLNLKDLIETVQKLSSDHSIAFMILDDKSNVIGASIDLKPEKKDKVTKFISENKADEISVSFEGYSFSNLVKVKDFPCLILIGQQKSSFYLSFFNYVYPQILFILIFATVLICISYGYHHRIMNISLRHFKEKTQSLQKTISELNKENFKVLAKKERADEILRCAEEAIRAEKKFLLEVNKRVNTATSDLISMGEALIGNVKGSERIDENPQKVMSIFENAYIHAQFFCSKSEVREINLKKVLDEVIKIHSFKMIKNDLTLSQKIEQDLPALLSDEVSVKQVLINLLARAIKNSPTEGEIELSIVKKQDRICIELRDKGYAVESNHLKYDNRDTEDSSLDCTFLDWSNLIKLTKSLGGTLSNTYELYRGNHFTLDLPIRPTKKNQRSPDNKQRLHNNVISLDFIKNKK